MITDLDQSDIWQLEDLWIKIAKVKAKYIENGLAKLPQTADCTPEKSEEPF